MTFPNSELLRCLWQFIENVKEYDKAGITDNSTPEMKVKLNKEWENIVNMIFKNEHMSVVKMIEGDDEND